jgi:hypothetical protein
MWNVQGAAEIKTGSLPASDITRKPGYPLFLSHRTQDQVLIMLNCKAQALTRRIDEVISFFANPAIEEIPTPRKQAFLGVMGGGLS